MFSRAASARKADSQIGHDRNRRCVYHRGCSTCGTPPKAGSPEAL